MDHEVAGQVVATPRKQRIDRKWSWAVKPQETPQQLISCRKPHLLTGSTTFQNSSNSQYGTFPIQISAPATPPHPLCNGHAICCVLIQINLQVPGHSHPPLSMPPLTGVWGSMPFSALSIYSLLTSFPTVAFS